MRLILFAMAGLLVIGCEKPEDNPIQKGQSYVDQARAVSAADAEQKIQLARGMIEAGRLEDASRLLAELDTKDLPAESKEKLDQVHRDLESAVK